MLQAIIEISRVQSEPTRDTEKKQRILLHYAETYTNAIIRYKAINVVLHVHSDASYLIIPEVKICYAGHLYLRDWPSPSLIKPNPDINDHIQTLYKQSIMPYP